MTDSVGVGVRGQSAAEVAPGERPLTTPTVPLLSWSRLQDSSCWRKYYYARILNLPQRPQGPTLGGVTVHKIIEWAEKEKRRPDEMVNRFGREWSIAVTNAGDIRWGGRVSKQYPNGEDASWWFQNGPKMLDNYFALKEDAKIIEGSVEARIWIEFGGAARGGNKTQDSGDVPEISSVVPIPDGSGSVQVEPAVLKGLAEPAPPILVQGYIDQMRQDSKGPFPVDIKTGQVQPTTAFQLATYALGWERLTGEVVDRGQAIPLRKHKEVIWFDLTEPKKVIEGMYQDLATGIKMHQDSGVWPASPSNLCKSCSVLAHCPEGQAMIAAKEEK